MSSCSRLAAAAVFVFGFAAAAGAQQAAGPQGAARCGGLFCDLYYSRLPAGEPVPEPGQPGSVFLPCHDFICGVFGGRTPDQPVAVATEPVPAEPAAKPKHKRVAKHVAKEGSSENAKPAKPAEPPAQ